MSVANDNPQRIDLVRLKWSCQALEICFDRKSREHSSVFQIKFFERRKTDNSFFIRRNAAY